MFTECAAGIKSKISMLSKEIAAETQRRRENLITLSLCVSEAREVTYVLPVLTYLLNQSTVLFHEASAAALL